MGHPAFEMTALRKWDYCVNEAKKKLVKANHYRIQVAKLAEKACVIQWGGQNHHTFKTLKDFAEEIGMHKDTLQCWVAYKRKVVDKLPIKAEELNHAAIVRTAQQVDRGASQNKVEKIYKFESNRNPDQLKLNGFVQRLQSCNTFFRRIDIKKLPKKEVSAIATHCKEILANIN